MKKVVNLCVRFMFMSWLKWVMTVEEKEPTKEWTIVPERKSEKLYYKKNLTHTNLYLKIDSEIILGRSRSAIRKIQFRSFEHFVFITALLLLLHNVRKNTMQGNQQEIEWKKNTKNRHIHVWLLWVFSYVIRQADHHIIIDCMTW